MRDIKFRVWIPKKTGGEMEEYPEMTEWDVADNIDFMQQLGKGGIILQYTGLKDVEGSEIYEGDLFPAPADNLYRVAWNDQAAKFSVVIERTNGKMIGIGKISMQELTKLKVAGNIYENPINKEQFN